MWNPVLFARRTLHAYCITHYLVSAEDAPWGRLLLCSSEAFKRYQNGEKNPQFTLGQ